MQDDASGNEGAVHGGAAVHGPLVWGFEQHARLRVAREIDIPVGDNRPAPAAVRVSPWPAFRVGLLHELAYLQVGYIPVFLRPTLTETICIYSVKQ